MEKQISFTDLEYGKRRKVTKREVFLTKMDAVLPRNGRNWCPFFRMESAAGPAGDRVMLRMLMLQVWFQLSDEGVEDAIYDSYAMKSFLGLNFAKGPRYRTPQPCKFRSFAYPWSAEDLLRPSAGGIEGRRQKAGEGGTIVDATIIEAPDSRKMPESLAGPGNALGQEKAREMALRDAHPHCFADPLYGFVHTISATSANASEVKEAPTYCGKTMRWSMEMRAANWIAM